MNGVYDAHERPAAEPVQGALLTILDNDAAATIVEVGFHVAMALRARQMAIQTFWVWRRPDRRSDLLIARLSTSS